MRPSLARDAGAELTAALLALPQVSEVRGLGLLLAAEIEGLDAREVAARCLDAGLVVNGVSPTAVRLAPALIITSDHIAEAVGILGSVMNEMAS